MAPGELTSTVAWERVNPGRVTIGCSGAAGSDWLACRTMDLDDAGPKAYAALVPSLLVSPVITGIRWEG